MRLKNDLVLKALRREFTERTPIWIMRQAGRYLPEYRRVREKAGSFMKLCKNPELACEVTLQPLERFKLDASIVFSDILTIPDALGLGVSFVEHEGPQFEKTIQSTQDIHDLGIVDPHADLSYVMDTIRLVKQSLGDRLPLFGFSGSPFTLATYMLEGGSSKTFIQTKSLMYQEPQSFELLLEKLTQSVIAYLKAQIEAGADAIQIFDSFGGILSTAAFQRYSLPYLQKIVQALKFEAPHIPVVLFVKSGGLWLNDIVETGCDALSLDWHIDLHSAYSQVGHRVALQGNLDPCALFGSEETIETEVLRILDAYQGRPGHVFNLGHGILPPTDPGKVTFLIDAVKQYSLRKPS